MIVVLALIVVLSLAVFIFLQQPQFGKAPNGARLERIKKSPNYRDGAFHNFSPTPIMADDASYFSAFKGFLFGKKVRRNPIDAIPSTKIDLLHLDPTKDILIWLGHSSYLMQLDGKKILVDPVLSGSASPVAFTTKAFKGTDPYSTDDIPEIDYLFITHDHWDHLDYSTITRLKPKIRKIITGLGTGEHLEYWGFPKDIIIEGDWYDQHQLDSGFLAVNTPARHFSGRTFKRNQTLWTSFVLQTPSYKIFLGGDGGYETHFAEINKRFGDMDLAILENGQYNQSWRYIHTLPEQTIQAAKDLHAKRVLPVHSAKFVLSVHPWDEPLIKISELSKGAGFQLLTPIIGEPVDLKDSTQVFKNWWEEVK